MHVNLCPTWGGGVPWTRSPTLHPQKEKTDLGGGRTLCTWTEHDTARAPALSLQHRTPKRLKAPLPAPGAQMSQRGEARRSAVPSKEKVGTLPQGWAKRPRGHHAAWGQRQGDGVRSSWRERHCVGYRQQRSHPTPRAPRGLMSLQCFCRRTRVTTEYL